MKEGCWEDCIESASALTAAPDQGKIKSLIETARQRVAFLDENQIKDSNASFIFEGQYSSMIEFAHAFVLGKGFKITNHICIGFFLRDVVGRQDIYRAFDDARRKRNSLVYYGSKLGLEEARQAIVKCKWIIAELSKLMVEHGKG